MLSELALWLVFLVPLGSFVFISLIIRPFFNRYRGVSAYITIAAVGLSFVLSIMALADTISGHGHVAFDGHEWFSAGAFTFEIGILLDPLTAVMIVVVSSISLLVQIYSIGYMKGDPGYARYYASMSLFTAAMLGLILASNLIQIFVFWELVGLGSYLLIGFWFERPAAAAAAKKAFIMTRLGDFGLLLAILLLFFNLDQFVAAGLNPMVIEHIYHAVEPETGFLGSGIVLMIALGLFAGAMGKSAQFPLHTWLPDAMEGPTPVSALIHAATMVVAGVFLVARFFPLFEASAPAMNVVAIIGGITAIFAASMGLVANDIKRVLAYSTVSQLGYMMLALGIGAYGAAIFHLVTHAFFKALLFLGSGSVNHATGTFDMRFMGGLRKVMPITYITFLIGSLSLAGIFPLAGFWSKDEILGHALGNGDAVSMIVFILAIIAVFMTAFYMFRALFMTFHGEFKGGADAEPDGGSHGAVHLGESPMVMAAPLLILVVPAIVAGFLINSIFFDIGPIPKHWINEFLGEGPVALHAAKFNFGLAIISTLIAFAGIGLAYLMYMTKAISPDKVGAALKPVHTLLIRKYYMDELYESVFTTSLFYNGLTRIGDWLDRAVVDRIANILGWLASNIGHLIRQLQTGQLQGYGIVISIGVLFIFGVFIFIR